jgi:hypothetical protein
MEWNILEESPRSLALRPMASSISWSDRYSPLPVLEAKGSGAPESSAFAQELRSRMPFAGPAEFVIVGFAMTLALLHFTAKALL